jgi:hypothetical protein
MPSVMANTLEIADAVPVTGAPPAPLFAPYVTQVPSGAQSQRFEWIRVTFVNAAGESAPSPEVVIQVAAGNVVQVAPVKIHGLSIAPGAPTGWNVYCGTSGSGNETKQNASPLTLPVEIGGVPTSGFFQEPATGFSAGSALPTAVAPVPGLTSGLSGLVNTPPVTGALVPPQSPSGAVITNTGRSQSATATFLSRMVIS